MSIKCISKEHKLQNAITKHHKVYVLINFEIKNYKINEFKGEVIAINKLQIHVMNASEQKGYLYNHSCDPDVLRAQWIRKIFFLQML